MLGVNLQKIQNSARFLIVTSVVILIGVAVSAMSGIYLVDLTAKNIKELGFRLSVVREREAVPADLTGPAQDGEGCMPYRTGSVLLPGQRQAADVVDCRAWSQVT